MEPADESSPAAAGARGTCCAPCVLAEHEQWIVVHKPAGWHSVDAPRSSGGSVLSQWIARERPEMASLRESGLVHRLDRCTSGCVIAARSAESWSRLRAAFSGRGETVEVRKHYLALASAGIALEGRFDLVFSSRHKGSAKVTVRSDGEGERGSCAWRVRRGCGPDAPADAPGAFDLLEVDLRGPGRRHQIRAGLAFLGHPLAGDSLYRGTPLAPQWIGECFALHAWRVAVDGIVTESPPPAWAQDPPAPTLNPLVAPGAA